MKLNKLVGFIAATAMAIGMTTLTYAADESGIVLGKPIDLETNAVAEKYEAGDIIALPVDIYSTTDVADAFSTVVGFDTQYIAADVDTNNMEMVSDTVYNNLITLSGSNGDESNFVTQSDVMGALKGMYTEGRGGVRTYVGTYTYNPAYAANQVYISWFNNSNVDLRDTPEVYLIFRVIKDVPSDSLNFDVFSSTNTGEVKPGVDHSYADGGLTADTSDAKLNACFGAFNINIDSSALPYWIQALYVKVGGGEAVQVTEYSTTDDVNYAFPVRITSNSGNADSVTVEVLADTSTDEAGNEGTQSQVSMGTFEVQLNSPTSYVDQTVSAQ